MKKRPDPAERPSREFEEAFVDSGGCVCHCDCGRIHFDSVNHYDWNDGELEGLKKKAAQHPDKYLESSGSVEAMHIAGAEFVVGCPCNRARRYEDFIINHACSIARFLSARAKNLMREAEAASMSAMLAEKINGATAAKLIVEAGIEKVDAQRQV
jgi:hypothetical protein